MSIAGGHGAEGGEGRVAVEDRDGLRDGGFLPRAEHVALLELLRLGGAALRERREEPPFGFCMNLLLRA